MLGQHNDVMLIVLDALTYAGNLDNLQPIWDDKRMLFFHGDIRDDELVADLMRNVEYVVHFAAETHVDRSIHDAGIFIETDVFGTFVLLEKARYADIKRFVHISTDEVYGEAPERPSLETDALMPKSPYAASKAGADRLAFSYFTTYGLPVVISRCSNNYGPYQHPEKLIPLFVTNALEDELLPVYGNGKSSRDWIYVMDHCRAIDALLWADGVEGEAFNIGAANELNVLQITDIILKQLKKPESLINHVDDRLGHVMRHAVDTTKIRETIGWEPEYGFEENIDVFVGLNLLNQPTQVLLNILSPPRFVKTQCLSTKGIVFFNKIGVISLFRQVFGSGDAGKAAAYHQGGLAHLYFRVIQGFQKAHFGNSHAYQILGLYGGCISIPAMDPGALIADVGHFKEVFIDARIDHRFPKELFVGARATGGHNHPV